MLPFRPILLASLAAAAWLAPAAPAAAQAVAGPKPQAVEDRFVPHPPVRVETWVDGLEVPWSLALLPDGRALVSERPGRIRLIEDGRLRREPYAVIAGPGRAPFFESAVADWEAGLLGIALHPDFPRAPFVYALHSYRKADGGYANRVVRLRHRGDTGAPDRMILDGIPGGQLHNGGRIGFGPDGMLYVAAGDAREPGLAADRGSLAGKILRVTPEGAIPADNPFPGSPVYSYGHRNPQGLAWEPVTGALFASEHGPSGEYDLFANDEINAVAAGVHHGWPAVVGAPGDGRYRDPVAAWPESATPPAGMTFWRGDLYVATLLSEALLRISLRREDGGWRVAAIERWFADGPDRGRYGRLRDAVAGPDGALYLLTSNRDWRRQPNPGDDRILRIVAE